MNRNRLFLGAAAALIVLIAGFWIFDSVSGDTQPASGPMTAIPINAQPTSAPEPTTAPADPAPATPTETTPVATASPAPVAPTEAPTAPPAGVAPNQVIRYQIVADESKVSFRIAEDLRGQRIEAIGTTNQVAGEFAINPSDLTTAQIGVIRVNARTFATDSGNRDRAIRNFILNTDQYEFITFTPTAIEGLSGSGALNEPFTFTIRGDLTIRDITRPVAFEATVRAESAERLVGVATTTVKRSDYNLQIPSVPFVANVSDDVVLTIEFVALAAAP
ncbi:MAG: polyisoprenoid-binding protein [Roseiflexus castenholzii]|uniref:YceI family protein n=1 Tax=Roseiflexus castenholzii TaxID=120962 RepID=UPI000CAAC35C|nr:MAG: polyisoprenoid-binding protein [Roseiflexus castenholzii]